MPVSLPDVQFDNRYAQLPERLFSKLNATPVSNPQLFAFNGELAAKLRIDRSTLSDAELAEIFAGNAELIGSDPLAAAYAGHQFGHWSGMLGDGRAILLGEVNSTEGQHYDIQLKGSGRTPYSRGGDGRAWLGPVIREYLISNTMPRYDVPSTLALAAVTTGEAVLREQGPLPGAVLTRVAKSHVRVGTFEFLAAQRDVEGAKALVQLLIDTVYPHLNDAENKPLALLNAVIERQADLIARWQALGFIHGVMNTDNASLAGETIDYGPCAFMDEFNREKVFSSIDQQGRYAYKNQPRIGHWNMAMLAQAMLPLLADTEANAITFAQTAVDKFPELYAQSYQNHMRRKFGLGDELLPNDDALMESFLSLMEASAADFTQSFRALGSDTAEPLFTLFNHSSEISDWHEQWRTRIADSGDVSALNTVNPAVIPRNHWVEATISSAVGGDWSVFENLNKALESPYQDNSTFSQPPSTEERVTATFCGT